MHRSFKVPHRPSTLAFFSASLLECTCEGVALKHVKKWRKHEKNAWWLNETSAKHENCRTVDHDNSHFKCSRSTPVSLDTKVYVDALLIVVCLSNGMSKLTHVVCIAFLLFRTCAQRDWQWHLAHQKAGAHLLFVSLSYSNHPNTSQQSTDPFWGAIWIVCFAGGCKFEADSRAHFFLSKIYSGHLAKDGQ